MITFKEAVLFLQKHSKSGVWIERSQATVYSDSSNGHSVGHPISSSAFNFLQQAKLLNDNSYGGFKGYRIFDKKKELNKVDVETLEVEFKKYQARCKKIMKKDLKSLELCLSTPKVFVSKLSDTCKNLTDLNIEFSFSSGTYSRYGGSSPSALTVGEQSFTYFSWRQDYKSIMKHIVSRIEKMKVQIESEEINDYIDSSRYARAFIGHRIESLIRSVGAA